MVTIRLSRGGAKKRPFYHIVATDKRSARDGRYIERLGYFNPIASGQQRRIFVDLSRIEYWVAQGAQPSDRVMSLIKEAKKLPPEALQPERRLPKKPVMKAPPKAPEEAVPKAAKGHAKKAPAKKAPARSAAGKKEGSEHAKPKAKKDTVKKATKPTTIKKKAK